MHADRTNRTMLLLLALLLITAGAAVGAASIGAFGTATRHSPRSPTQPGTSPAPRAAGSGQPPP
jgi:hypothetical protein